MRISLLVCLFVTPLFQLTVGDLAVARNLVVCIDGTGNHPDDAEERGSDTTNVYRLSQYLIEDDDQDVEYFSGVGTSGWTLIDAKGEFAGFGARRIRDKALDYLSEQTRDGDKIFIFGFSRGAAIARDLANHIHDGGLGRSRRVGIEVLGLWDTVAAFGVPIDVLGLPTQDLNVGKKLNVPPSVRHVYHLLSIDERRTPFIPTLVEARSNVQEVWFPGVHADVGGGYESRRLADTSLLFMIERVKTHGLRFGHRIDAITPNPEGKGKIHTYHGNLPQETRAIIVRKNNQRSRIRPKIHRSAVARMASGYRPQNLIDLGDAYDVVE